MYFSKSWFWGQTETLALACSIRDSPGDIGRRNTREVWIRGENLTEFYNTQFIRKGTRRRKTSRSRSNRPESSDLAFFSLGFLRRVVQRPGPAQSCGRAGCWTWREWPPAGAFVRARQCQLQVSDQSRSPNFEEIDFLLRACPFCCRETATRSGAHGKAPLASRHGT